MSDVMTKEQRSRVMSRIKSKDTGIEVLLRKALWHKGVRYRKNYKKLPGTPDIAVTKYKVAIFCDSEFFHGHDWKIKKHKLGQNREYWIKKIERNMERDGENDFKLIQMNWISVHFWGNEIQKHTDECVEAVLDLIFELRMAQFDSIVQSDEDYEEINKLPGN